MLKLSHIDHVGLRISDRETSIAFYEKLGFKLLLDGGFGNGHPLILLHPSGININLLGPSRDRTGTNILMDVDEKYSGITHIALKVISAEETEAYITDEGIPITGRHNFNGVKTIFIRDPDRNVIELVGPGHPVAKPVADAAHDDHTRL